MKKYLFFTVFFASISPIIANPLVINEESAVDLAVAQNYELKSSYIELEKTKDQYENSWNVLLPDLSFETSITNTNGIVDTSVDNSLTLTSSFVSSVSLNKSSRYYIEYDKLSYEAQNILYQYDQEALKLEVKKAYYYLIAHKQSLQLEKMNLDLAYKRYIQMEMNYEYGLVSELDVLESQSTYENLKPSYTSANTSYETQLMAFKVLLGIDIDQEIELEGDLDIEILSLSSDKLISNYINNRLDLVSAQKSIEIEETLLDIEKASDFYPTLNLSLDYSVYNSDLLDSDWSDSVSLNATISIPINGYIDGSEEDIAISDAKRCVNQAQLSYQNTLEEAKIEIETLILEINGYKESMEISEIAIDISQKTYDANVEAYELGTCELLNLEEAQNTLFSAKQDLLTSQYNYLSAILDLEYALNVSSDDIKSVN